MSRRGRLHVPGGFYYVIQHGSAPQPIFTEPSDYAIFEQLLARMTVRCSTRVHAFCWTRDTIQMVVQVSDWPIARLMQRLTSQYARRVHRQHGGSGHLFQHRYRALLVDPDRYLLRLIRHIHLTPVRARIAREPSEYTLSSHNAYLGVISVPWLATGAALRMLASHPDDAQQAYRRFMSESGGEADRDLFERGSQHDPRVVGDREFVRALPRRPVRAYRSAHSLEQVIETVSRKLGLDRTAVLSRSRQRNLAMARAVITWYATERGIATLAEVSRRLERDPSTLLAAMDRYQALRPDLFDVAELHDPAPILEQVPDASGSQL